VKDYDIEKYSSAITLSDMEIFVYPDLMYSLVLANIMSPNIWQWRKEDTFRKLKGKNRYRKLMRLRQYIMDEYEFNLDIETWGMTSKDRELKRFAHVISPEEVARSNALFGYTGDKYYFDVDIRRHFGLDKYDDDAIPYWKTETVEAMDAFVYKDGYTKRAGECVSLSSLYAAAAFIICGIPLEDIYLILTPLHSQNFIDIKDGVVTNNRRVVTKGMWFNGTEISMKAQRALKNEQVTIVAHSTGNVHCIYPEASIDKGVYDKFRGRLNQYLSGSVDLLMLANFLRDRGMYQKYFQFCHHRRGQSKFVKAEKLFSYEHGSNFRIADETYERLLDEVATEDYSLYKYSDRMCCEELRAFVEYEGLDIAAGKGVDKLRDFLKPVLPDADEFVSSLRQFLHTDPILPGEDKSFNNGEPIVLSSHQSHGEVIEYLRGMRSKNETVDLAFYALRDMGSCRWEPFVKAAVERNPVSIDVTCDMSIEDVRRWLGRMVNESIYEGQRLAQPDEAANFQRADGVEKALLLANIIWSRNEESEVEIVVDKQDIVVKSDGKDHRFVSCKGFDKHILLTSGGKVEVDE